jgi:hypothetical protein
MMEGVEYWIMTSPSRPSEPADGSPLPHRRKVKRPVLVSIIWLAILFLTCGLLLPQVVVVRDSEAYSYSINHLRRISLAFHNYHDAYGRLPPAVVRDKDGRPLYSWRVAILPYLEEDHLYRQFNHDEPWDGPNNSRLLAKMPSCYYRPWTGSMEQTHYLAVVGPGTAFERDGLTWADFQDDRANTVVVVEATDAVPWSKPVDLVYDPNGPLPKLGTGMTRPVRFLNRTLSRRPGITFGFADGQARFLDEPIPNATVRAFITRSGGETVSRDR